jgi:hypothetical protein
VLNRRIIINNDGKPLVDGGWAVSKDQKAQTAQEGIAIVLERNVLLPRVTNNIVRCVTKTNYEHLSQFVIPNWGTQSAF